MSTFWIAENRLNFSHSINVKSKDEFGETANALNKAQENVSNLVKLIIEDSEDIGASSEELSATVEELFSKVVIIDEAAAKLVK